MEMSIATGSDSLEAPLLQHMTTDIESLSGIVIRQQAQWGEVLAQAALLPYEAFNKYKVSELPANRSVARDLPATWKPTGAELDALPELMRVEESSSPWLRSLLTCLGKNYLLLWHILAYSGVTAACHDQESDKQQLPQLQKCRQAPCSACGLAGTPWQSDLSAGRLSGFTFNTNCLMCIAPMLGTT